MNRVDGRGQQVKLISIESNGDQEEEDFSDDGSDPLMMMMFDVILASLFRGMAS